MVKVLFVSDISGGVADCFSQSSLPVMVTFVGEKVVMMFAEQTSVVLFMVLFILLSMHHMLVDTFKFGCPLFSGQ